MSEVLHPLTRARLADLLTRMRDVRIAVVGDIMLDRYLVGDVERISPEAPVPVVMVDNEFAVPGGAANVAANIAALGGTAILVGAIGSDGEGAFLTEAVQSLGIAAAGLVVVPGRPTTAKTRILARGQQVVRIDREVTNPLADRFRDAVLAAAHNAMADADVLVIEDYDKGTIDAGVAADLVEAARAAGMSVVVDPKRRNFFAFPAATVFKPNLRELEAAFGTHFMGDDSDLEAARVKLGVEHLVLTRGADGLALLSPGKPLRETPAVNRDVFDVSGAGDTVSAWLGAAIAAGADIAEAAWLANLAAGVEVGKRGTATVSQSEVIDAWEAAAD